MPATDDAITGIRALIASGEFGPGAKLPKEADLSARLGLSRNSLREAVSALELVGILKVRQGDGTYVTSLDPSLLLDVVSLVIDFSPEDSLLQLLEVRRLLEPGAAAMAAARASEEQLDEIGEALERVDERSGIEALVESDIAFHDAIARASGNLALTALLGSLSGTTFRARVTRGHKDVRAVEETQREHARIYQALRARDPEQAHAASAFHIGSVETWLRQQNGRSRSE